MSLQRLTRVFKKGPTRLLDPDPAMTPEQVLEHYTDLYPELANATISEPETSERELTYTFEKPIVKTKGGEIEIGDAVHHAPSGENWVVARVDAEHLYPAGWPCTRERVAECSLLQKATPAQRTEMVERLKNISSDDPRHIKS